MSNKQILIRLLLVPLLCFGLYGDVFAGPSVLDNHFGEGERLEYALSWYKINAGYAVLTIGKKNGDTSSLSVISEVRSNRFFSLFFPVRDTIETVVDAGSLVPTYLKVDQREGRRRRSKEVVFDQKMRKAFTKILKGGKIQEEVYDLPPLAQNSLSAFYYLRAQGPLEPGRSVFINVHAGGKNWKLEAEVLGRELLETRTGSIHTMKVKASVMFEGMFLDKGDVFIWFSDDKRMIPVLIRCKISFGEVTAKLLKVESSANTKKSEH